jgi:FkbM family methyltransferase
MFELTNKKYTFKDFPDRELNVWGRNDTLDFELLNGVAEYDFPSIYFNDSDTIIDIGAYTGQEALYFMAMGLNLRYLAFEPITENFRVLELNIKDNNKCLDIDWFDNAIGDYVGQGEIHLGGGGEGKWKTIYRFMGDIKPPFRSNETRKTFQITLEYIFKSTKIKKCKLLKIDCEGAELKILKVAPKYILDKIHYIIGEYHEPNTLKEITKATKGLFKNTIESDHLFKFVHK